MEAAVGREIQPIYGFGLAHEMDVLMPTLKRYLPELRFPNYQFVPGRHPHPSRDPDGHSFGVERSAPAYLPPSQWSSSRDYLFGVDLYNYGYFWEAHEAWEELWLAARDKGDQTQTLFLQSLIQLSAARLKLPMSQPTGFYKLAKVAQEKLSVVIKAEAIYMGIDLIDFTQRWQAFVISKGTGVGPDIFLAFENS